MTDTLSAYQWYVDANKWLGNQMVQGWKYAWRPTGWTIPDDADIGGSLSFKEAEVGAGLMEMDLKDLRHPPRYPLYKLYGGYLEVGFGKGSLGPRVESFIENLANKMKKVKPNSDFIIAPGGSLGNFIMGVTNPKPLEISDFTGGSWIYFHVGGELVLLQGDIGLMFLVDPTSLNALVNLAIGNISGFLTTCMGGCLAWAPYYGLNAGLGQGAKIALRYIKSVHMTTKAS